MISSQQFVYYKFHTPLHSRSNQNTPHFMYHKYKPYMFHIITWDFLPSTPVIETIQHPFYK